MSLRNVVLLSLVEIVGDFGFKAFARTGTGLSFVQGTLGYVGVVYFLIQSLKGGNLMYVNGMWDGVSAALSTLAAYLFLGERLNRPIEYAGLAVIMLGIFMLHAPNDKIPY
jgi:multidrug transporter EmrE-like cation transporter